jgi:predicted phage gp36 major capsid-like protein
MGNCCSNDNQDAITTKDVKGRSPDRKKRTSRRKAKGAAVDDEQVQRFETFEKDINKEEAEELWTNPDLFEQDEESDDDDMESDKITLKRKGETKDLFKESFMKKAVKHCSKDVRTKWKSLGTLQYR